MSTFFCQTRDEVEIFERCYRNQLPLMLKGPTGCGKSQLVHFMAEKLNVPLVKVACNEDTSSADLLGRFLIKGAETVWQDGPVSRAIRQGGILYMDEIAEAREDVIVALHPLTDHRREVYLDRINETLRAPANFMFVASYNPGYQQSFKEFKPSTRQRFVTLAMDYLDAQNEINMLREISKVDEGSAKKLVNLGQKIRNLSEYNLQETVSSRLLINAGSMIRDGMTPRKAAYITIAEVLSDDREIVGAIKDIIDLSL